MKPTREDLQRAYNRLKTERRAWPATLDECLAVPLMRVQIECEARSQSKKKERPTSRSLPVFSRSQSIDFKSRAAGEKDDD